MEIEVPATTSQGRPEKSIVAAELFRELAITVTFMTALLLAIGLFAYAPIRFLQWAADIRAAEPAAMWKPLGPIALAVVSILAGLRWALLLAMSWRTHRRQRQPVAEPSHWPRVSVFVPAFNEETTITAALESLLAMDYPDYEVIVVDDGSTDRTFEIAQLFEHRHATRGIRVFRKPNGGKWSAHNYAFSRSTGELVLCLDADSRLEPHALRRMVARMNDPGVTAVAGQIRVRNRVNTLTRLQAVEYLMANGALRMAQSLTGTVLVVPGPIGLFRRSALEEVYLRFGQIEGESRAGEVPGPFEGDTFAEDFDLSLAVLSLGGRIIYQPDAVSHTKAPTWTSPLINQRYRWSRGAIQVVFKYLRRAWRQPDVRRPVLLAWLTGTYIFELLFLPFVYFSGIGLLVAFLLADGDPLPLLAWAGAFFLMNLNVAACYTAIHRDKITLLRVLPVYDFYHGFVLNAAWLIAVFDQLRRAPMRW